MLYLSRITDATVDAFATCGFNVRMRKYASCGPRLTWLDSSFMQCSAITNPFPGNLNSPGLVKLCLFLDLFLDLPA